MEIMIEHNCTRCTFCFRNNNKTQTRVGRQHSAMLEIRSFDEKMLFFSGKEGRKCHSEKYRLKENIDG